MSSLPLPPPLSSFHARPNLSNQRAPSSSSSFHPTTSTSLPSFSFNSSSASIVPHNGEIPQARAVKPTSRSSNVNTTSSFSSGQGSILANSVLLPSRQPLGSQSTSTWSRQPTTSLPDVSSLMNQGKGGLPSLPSIHAQGLPISLPSIGATYMQQPTVPNYKANKRLDRVAPNGTVASSLQSAKAVYSNGNGSMRMNTPLSFVSSFPGQAHVPRIPSLSSVTAMKIPAPIDVQMSSLKPSSIGRSVGSAEASFQYRVGRDNVRMSTAQFDSFVSKSSRNLRANAHAVPQPIARSKAKGQGRSSRRAQKGRASSTTTTTSRKRGRKPAVRIEEGVEEVKGAPLQWPRTTRPAPTPRSYAMDIDDDDDDDDEEVVFSVSDDEDMTNVMQARKPRAAPSVASVAPVVSERTYTDGGNAVRKKRVKQSKLVAREVAKVAVNTVKPTAPIVQRNDTVVPDETNLVDESFAPVTSRLNVNQPTSKHVVSEEIPEMPVYTPTAEEFADPFAFIASIKPEAEKYGCVKIKVPESIEWIDGKNWLNSVEEHRFKFDTKLQPVHRLQQRQTAVERFTDEVVDLHKSMFGVIPDDGDFPQVKGINVDLLRLYTLVELRGGLANVCLVPNGWRRVCDDLLLIGNGVVVERIYRTWLVPILDRLGPIAKQVQREARVSKDELAERDVLEEGKGKLHFGFGSGGVWRLTDYRQMSDNFKASYFEDFLAQFDAKAVVVSKEELDARITVEHCEKEFWNVVESGDRGVEVRYGNDLDVLPFSSMPESVYHPSLFPRGRHPVRDHAMNLNVITRVRDSLLRFLHTRVSGITDPMVYVGMLFSAFCWHTEDNYLYSINYHHGGAPKVWYGVPGRASEHFEAVMRAEFPSLFEAQPDLLFSLTTHLSPTVLHQHGVPVYRTVQSQGEFVVTFPAAFHSGFNTGFNIAEAVNFAPADWTPWARLSLRKYHQQSAYHRVSVFSYHNLITSAAHTVANVCNDVPLYVVQCLCDELGHFLQTQKHERARVYRSGINQVMQFPPYSGRDRDAEDDAIQDCFLSAVVCPCSTRVACTDHFAHLCACAPQRRRLLVRYTEKRLTNLMHQLSDLQKVKIAKGESVVPHVVKKDTKKMMQQNKFDVNEAQKWQERKRQH